MTARRLPPPDAPYRALVERDPRFGGGFHEAFGQLLNATPTRSGDGPALRLAPISTPLGPMIAGAIDERLCLLEFAERRMLRTQVRRLCRRLGCAVLPGTGEAAERAQEELDAYFTGALRRFSVPLTNPGTPFQRRVWEALRGIPYGGTRSYAEQARVVGRPDAVRAVARANGDNALAILVPCHRVVGSDGALTGYGGGLWRKRFLLDHERRHRDPTD